MWIVTVIEFLKWTMNFHVSVIIELYYHLLDFIMHGIYLYNILTHSNKRKNTMIMTIQ